MLVAIVQPATLCVGAVCFDVLGPDGPICGSGDRDAAVGQWRHGCHDVDVLGVPVAGRAVRVRTVALHAIEQCFARSRPCGCCQLVRSRDDGHTESKRCERALDSCEGKLCSGGGAKVAVSVIRRSLNTHIRTHGNEYRPCISRDTNRERNVKALPHRCQSDLRRNKGSDQQRSTQAHGVTGNAQQQPPPRLQIDVLRASERELKCDRARLQVVPA